MGRALAFVRWFDEDLRIGMLVGEDGEDVLFHRCTGRSDCATLRSGDAVEYQMCETDDRLFALSVCALDPVRDDNKN